ncbi:MAG: hypothetical protein IKP69_00465, partial [Oscillospiraceae bacterium]|nr:hypothetical protein [Oscillospiraceae bacterium]
YSATVLGYKKSQNREEAITDLSLLQMEIGYEDYPLMDYLQDEEKIMGENADKIIAILPEFKNNVEKGSPAALFAKDIYNYYYIDELDMRLGDYFLSDSCSREMLTKMMMRSASSFINTLYSTMTAAVADYYPDSSAPSLPEEEAVQNLLNETVVEVTMPAANEALEEETYSEIVSSEEETTETLTSEEETIEQTTEELTELFSEKETEMIPEILETESASETEIQTESESESESKSETETESETETSVAVVTRTAAEKTLLAQDTSYGNWASRVSQNAVAENLEDEEMLPIYDGLFQDRALRLKTVLQDFSKNYQDAYGRQMFYGENAVIPDVENAKSGEASEQAMEYIKQNYDEKGNRKENTADLYYLNIYHMLEQFPYDAQRNLAQYIVELGNTAYKSRNELEKIYPLAAALTEGQLLMMEVNGIGASVLYLFNTDEIQKQAVSEKQKLEEYIAEYNQKDYISVWDGVDQRIYEQNIAITDSARASQQAGNTAKVLNDSTIVKTQEDLTNALTILGYISTCISAISAIASTSAAVATVLGVPSAFSLSACAVSIAEGTIFASILGYAGAFVIIANWIALAATVIILVTLLI